MHLPATVRSRSLAGVAVIAFVMLAGAATTVTAAQAAAPSGAETVGLVDPAQGRWHVRDAQGDVGRFFFGNPGDVPLMGDWDCDGVDTPGMYRQSDGFVYLSNANRSQIADIRFFFGDPGDVPLAGDFDGDGCDTVSLYRPGEGRFFVIDELGAGDGGLGSAEVDYLFGNPGDKPFSGDFDGDGVDTFGLHRESTGLVYFRQSHSQGIADAAFIFGDPGDRLVAGDWNASGTDTPGLFRPPEARFYLRYTNTQGNADDEFPFGSPPWLPVAGHVGDLVDTPPAYTAAEVDYFVDIALGSEFGATTPEVHKWLNDVRISVNGVPTPGDLAALDEVLADLNALLDPIEVLRDDATPNVELHFAPLDELDDILPQYQAGNWGFVWVWWSGGGGITQAVVLIASDVTDATERAHLIREELTQGLGLLNDSYEYPDSIFQQAFTTVTEYAPIDEAVIEILYDGRIVPLMTEAEVRAAIE